MEDRIRDLLYRSLDGDLSLDERKDLHAALAASAELMRERDDALAMRGLIKESAERSFGPFFAERVVNTIRSEREETAGAPFFESLLYAFRRVAIAAAAVAAFLLIYNLNQGGSLSVAAAFGTGGEADIEEVLTAPVTETLEELL